MIDEHKRGLNKYHLSESYAGVLGAFSKIVQRVIEDNRELASMAKNQDEGKMLKK